VGKGKRHKTQQQRAQRERERRAQAAQRQGGKPQRQPRRKTPRWSGLAPEPATPPSIDDQRKGLSSYARQEIRKKVTAWMILLAYLEYAQDGDGPPADFLAPRREGESEEEFALRWKTDLLLAETTEFAGSPADQTAEVLASWITPSMVPGVLETLAGEVAAILDSSGYQPVPAAWQAGARSLFGALCPAEDWEVGLDQLEALASSRLAVTEQTEKQATAAPIATIHAAAALTAWLYGQPEAVHDEAVATSALADRAAKFGDLCF
jgi:hypothetical protein